MRSRAVNLRKPSPMYREQDKARNYCWQNFCLAAIVACAKTSSCLSKSPDSSNKVGRIAFRPLLAWQRQRWAVIANFETDFCFAAGYKMSAALESRPSAGA